MVTPMSFFLTNFNAETAVIWSDNGQGGWRISAWSIWVDDDTVFIAVSGMNFHVDVLR